MTIASQRDKKWKNDVKCAVTRKSRILLSCRPGIIILKTYIFLMHERKKFRLAASFQLACRRWMRRKNVGCWRGEISSRSFGCITRTVLKLQREMCWFHSVRLDLSQKHQSAPSHMKASHDGRSAMQTLCDVLCGQS